MEPTSRANPASAIQARRVDLIGGSRATGDFHADPGTEIVRVASRQLRVLDHDVTGKRSPAVIVGG